LAFSPFLNAQDTDIIKGVVKDKENNPLPFVRVEVIYEEKMITGTHTDFDGNYEIAVPDSLQNFSIRVTYVGFKPKEIQVKREEEKNKNE